MRKKIASLFLVLILLVGTSIAVIAANRGYANDATQYDTCIYGDCCNYEAFLVDTLDEEWLGNNESSEHLHDNETIDEYYGHKHYFEARLLLLEQFPDGFFTFPDGTIACINDDSVVEHLAAIHPLLPELYFESLAQIRLGTYGYFSDIPSMPTVPVDRAAISPAHYCGWEAWGTRRVYAGTFQGRTNTHCWVQTTRVDTFCDRCGRLIISETETIFGPMHSWIPHTTTSRVCTRCGVRISNDGGILFTAPID
jgi:hypothetical protein